MTVCWQSFSHLSFFVICYHHLVNKISYIYFFDSIGWATGMALYLLTVPFQLIWYLAYAGVTPEKLCIYTSTECSSSSILWLNVLGLFLTVCYSCIHRCTCPVAVMPVCEACTHLSSCLLCACELLLGFSSQQGLQKSTLAVVTSGGKILPGINTKNYG